MYFTCSVKKMTLITNYTLLDCFLALIPVVYFIYWYFTNNDDYWDKRGVIDDKRIHLWKMIRGKISQVDIALERYNKFSDLRFGGFVQFKQPVLFVKDPKLINRIMVKDFSHFPNRPQTKARNDPFRNSLFGLSGQSWRTLRYKLTPTFTTGKLKGMFDQISNCGENMMMKIETLSKENTDIETKSFLFEFTLDVVSSCAFGLQFEPGSPEFNEFKAIVSKVFNLFSPLFFIRFITITLFPKLAEVLNIRGFSSSKDDDYFIKLTKNTKKYRQENNITRNDYFQLLLKLQEQEKSGKEQVFPLKTHLDSTDDDVIINQMQYAGLDTTDTVASSTEEKFFTDDVIQANTFVFLLAGSESTSSTVSMTLYELSCHQELQKQLQSEVDSVLAKHGGWSYAAIKDMTYLDLVIQEALRLHPIISMLARECEIPYQVPDSDLVLEKGTQVFIPVVGLHKDPRYYPDPEEFRPERFVGNNFKPSSVYLPFGDGPRICIAMRFAVMEIKTCVAKIMSQYTVKLSLKTKQPLTFEPRSIFPTVKGGLWMTFEKRASDSNGL